MTCSIKKERLVQGFVRNNNVDQALKALKRKMQREGVFREMKLRKHYEKPSERKVREKAEAVRRARKLARKKLQREGQRDLGWSQVSREEWVRRGRLASDLDATRRRQWEGRTSTGGDVARLIQLRIGLLGALVSHHQIGDLKCLVVL
jgi:ribosomal protein S21